MKTVHKSVLLWFSAQEMYALVIDVPRYPEFLPWCDKTRVVEQHENGMTAEIGISISGIHHAFVTRNEHTEPTRVTLKLVNGPFSDLYGEWSFTAIGDGSERACKVDLVLHYGFSNAVLSKLVGPVFDKIAATLVDAFVKRAEQVYGE